MLYSHIDSTLLDYIDTLYYLLHHLYYIICNTSAASQMLSQLMHLMSATSGKQMVICSLHLPASAVRYTWSM